MITIYHYDIQNYFDGLTQEITEEQGAPPSWTFTPVPPIPDGKYAYFIGPNWIIVDEKPPLPTPPEPPVTNEAPQVI
jgi:hypothetical protein